MLSPLAIVVPSDLEARARRAGFVVTDAAPTVAPLAREVLRAWAHGTPEVCCAVSSADELLALRPLALFAACFGELFRSGAFRELKVVTGGLRAGEWLTRNHGGLILIENPTQEPRQGSVFPAIEELRLAAGEILSWLHDAPLGVAESYLAAYVGLVKSEAQVVQAQIRPDPFEGARLVVSAPVGSVRELVLFHAGPGESTRIAFQDVPHVVTVGASQVIAVPEALAGRVWLSSDAQTPTWIGPEDVLEGSRAVMGPHRLWSLSAAGELSEVPFGTPTDALTDAGWYSTSVTGDTEPTFLTLAFEHEPACHLWLNGTPVPGRELCLLPGENRLVVQLLSDAAAGQVTLIPDGACYLLELTRWQYWPDAPLAL